MAERSGEPPIEGDVQDPFDVHPPPLYEDQVLKNPDAKTAIYKDEVLLDSGASDCMVPSFGYLDLIRSAYHLVTIADGTMHTSDYQGLLHIQATCKKAGQTHTVPMLNALQVLGLHKVLWSVPALCAQGHDVAFGFTTVRIIFNVDTENQFIMYLNHPMLVDSNNLQLSMPSANFVQAVNQLPDDMEFQGSTEDSSYDSANVPSLESRNASTSSEEDSFISDDHSDHDDDPLMEVSLPDLMKDCDETSISSGQLEQDLHWAFNNIDEHTRNLNYDKMRAYLCDMHDEPFYQEDEEEDFDDVVSMSLTSQPDETGPIKEVTPTLPDDHLMIYSKSQTTQLLPKILHLV